MSGEKPKRPGDWAVALVVIAAAGSVLMTLAFFGAVVASAVAMSNDRDLHAVALAVLAVGFALMSRSS